jgi:uncharacterized HAD superfamily protein
MTMIKIGLDFDGVITDCGRLKELGALELFGVNIPAAQFKKEIVIEGGMLTTDQYRSLQETIYSNSEWGLKMDAVPGMKEWIIENKNNFEISIVTSRRGQAVAVAKEWLIINGLDLPIAGVGYGKTKKEATSGFAVFVDDDTDKLQELIGSVPNLFLYSWPYNEHNILPKEIKRVNGWSDLSEKVSMI